MGDVSRQASDDNVVPFESIQGAECEMAGIAIKTREEEFDIPVLEIRLLNES